MTARRAQRRRAERAQAKPVRPWLCPVSGSACDGDRTVRCRMACHELVAEFDRIVIAGEPVEMRELRRPWWARCVAAVLGVVFVIVRGVAVVARVVRSRAGAVVAGAVVFVLFAALGFASVSVAVWLVRVGWSLW